MKALLCVVAVLLMSCSAMAETIITEDVAVSSTWDLPGSPYIVQGSIAVTGNSTLTIDPDVAIQFDSGARLRTAGGSSIVAVGSAGSEIVFTSSAPSPAPGDWQSVYLRESPSSSFSYCIFEYGQNNLYADLSTAPVTFSTTRYAQYYGFACEHASLLISNCDIVDNERGIKISSSDSNPVVNNCNIIRNTYNSVYISNYDVLPMVTLDMENNWWGVDTAPEIESTMDIFSDPLYVEVDYDPWLHEVPVEATTWGKLKAMFAK